MLSKNNNCPYLKTPSFLAWCFTLLYLLPFGEGGKSFAQVNLVPNPSFESISSCPTNYSQTQLAIGWDTLKAGGGGGPDIFNKCANPSNFFGVPNNLYSISFQYPRSGVSYSNMGWYVNSTTMLQREYIQTKLTQPLTVGKTYCVKFYVSLTNRSQYAIDELGAYFDDGSISAPYYAPAIASPQIKSPTGIFYSDTLNWMKVEGLYTATSNYEYLTLGNFRTQAATNYTLVYPSSSGIIAEYYMDDVSVIELNSKAYAGEDKLVCFGDSVFIGSNEIGLECEWYNNNLQIAIGSGIWVKPNSQQQYVIRQDVCGTISYDTVQVNIKDTNCIPYVLGEIPNTFTPNNDGVNDVWQFNLGDDAVLNGITIYNRWGNLIHSGSGASNNNTVLWDGRTTSGEPCSEGIYFYVLNYTDAKGEQQSKTGYISLFR